MEELQSSFIAADQADSHMVSGGLHRLRRKQIHDICYGVSDQTQQEINLSEQLKTDTGKKAPTHLYPAKEPLTGDFFKAGLTVSINDTAALTEVLNKEEIRSAFPADARFAFGIPNRDAKGKAEKTVPFYVLKDQRKRKGTHGRRKWLLLQKQPSTSLASQAFP